MTFIMWKWSEVKVVQSCPTLCNLKDYGNSPGQDTGVGSLSLLQGIIPNPGIEPRSLTLQADSYVEEKTKSSELQGPAWALTGSTWQNWDSNWHLLIQVRTPFLLTLCRALHYVLGIQKWWWHALSKLSVNSEKVGANTINYTSIAWVRKLIFLCSSSPHSYSLRNLIGWAEHPSSPFHSFIDSFIYWSILAFIHKFIGFFINHTNKFLFMGSLPQARQALLLYICHSGQSSTICQ